MAETTAVLGGVWTDLIGQDAVVAELRRAVAGGSHAMTHAWLFTGPPGSGRSNAAKAFAAALQCERGGCGSCNACRTALAGSHPDVTNVRTEAIHIGVDEVRELVRKSAMAPTLRRYQVLVVEDADRITDRGADALLKSIEEPSPRTVWLLCAPTAEDVIVTIRSRCRQIGLATPSAAAIAELLRHRDGVGADLAEWAARVAGGHIGRARALALNGDARAKRAAALAIPARLTSLGECLQLAAELVGGTVLLKGPATVVAGQDGSLFVQAEDVPWLATAGTGDVLTGVIGALLAGHKDSAAIVPELPPRLAALGAMVHGRAAARAAALGQPGAIGKPIAALDVVGALPDTIADLLGC
ncbi:MAG: DNA polymerase III subunit delta' [Bifidobacteriaceae bacterium]|nr:DNA polymerase III subunit delta' [Bifidobacteriaceae bacterium]